MLGVCCAFSVKAQADSFVSSVTDQTVSAPLANPIPDSFQPRYISGFGSGNTFTVFFEDRDAGGQISFVSTTTGPNGFAANTTATNITDTHFVIKDWPITVGGTNYAYRAWASVGNNRDHAFYVSNDLSNWTQVSTFTIDNASDLTGATGFVYYGFHDVILLNGTYYAFAESNTSQTMLVRSTNGDDVWEAFALVGGRSGDGPLELPAGVSAGWTPSGAFVDLGHDRGYGKVYVDPRDSNLYLAINTTAKTSLPAAELEAAFINPANWTWDDGNTGPVSNSLLAETTEHDIREAWVVPNSDSDADWVIVYDADFGADDGGKALGYATLTPPALPPDAVFVDASWSGQSDVDAFNTNLVWMHDAFSSIQDAINAAASKATITVAAGQYNLSQRVTISKSVTLLGARAGVDPRTAAATRTAGDSNESIIDGGGTVSTLFRIEADDVTINGFDIRNGTGDLITSPSSGTIANPLIRYNFIRDASGDEGIQLRNASAAIVEFNKVHDTVGDGINLSGSSTNGIVRHNEVHDIASVNAAIYLDGAQNSTVTNNLIYNVTQNDGIKVGDKGGSNAAQPGGQITNNVIHDTAQDGITIYMSDVTVTGNEVFNSASENGAIFIDFDVSNITISNNNVHDNGVGTDSKLTFALRVGKDNNPSNVTISSNSFANNEIQLFSKPSAISNISSIVADNTFDETSTVGVNIVVGGVSGDPTTIQNAITAASDGDIIFVPAGTYTEAIEVDKPVTLLGNQRGVDARGRTGQAESIVSGRLILSSAADNVLIDGFTILNGANIGGENAGIFLAAGATDATVQNSVFTREGVVDGDSFRGILTTANGGNINLTVTRNSFSGWATGVFINPNATDAVISNNEFVGNFVGMSVDGPDNTSITGNAFTNNGFEGLGIGPGATNPSFTLSGNSFTGNQTHIGVYIDTTVNLSANSFDGAVTISNSGSVHTTIQNAINAASNGDTVAVAAGTYREQLTINGKSLTINGAGIDQTIIKEPTGGLNITSDVYQGIIGIINNASVTLNNITIDGEDQAIGLSDQRTTGIYVNNADATIDGVRVTGIRQLEGGGLSGILNIFAIRAIGIGQANQLIVRNSTIDNFHRSGIFASGNQLTALINNNTITGTPTAALIQNAIQLSSWSDNYSGTTGTISNNTITGVGYTGDPANGDATSILVYMAGAGVEVVDNALSASDDDNTHIIGIAFSDGSDFDLAGAGHSNAPIVTGNNLSGFDTGIVQIGSRFSGAIDPAANTFNNNGVNYKLQAVGGQDSSDPDAPQNPNPFTVTGTEGADVFISGSAADSLSGGGGADDINGNDGDDNLSGGAGTDIIKGGSGIDASSYTSVRDNYRISLSGDSSFTVTDSTLSRDGSDSLTNIEKLVFTDNNVLLVGGSAFASVADANAAATAGDTILVFQDAATTPLNSLSFPDVALANCVQNAIDTDGLTLVNELTSLDCSGMGIQSVFGVGQLSALTSLVLSNNQITAIDVSNLSALQSLTILNNPLSSTAISYLDTIDGTDGLSVLHTVVTPPPIIEEEPEEEPEEEIEIPETPPPSEVTTPSEEIVDTTEALDEEITNIVIPDSGEEITEETVEAIDNVLDDITTLAEDTSARVETGEITTEDALVVLDTLGDALDLAGNAASQGADIDQANVSQSVDSITNILNALDEEEPLEQIQVEQLQEITERAVDTVADLIDEESSDEEVEALVTDIEALLVSSENAGAGLTENVVTAAQTLSQKALDNTLDDIVTDLGIEDAVDSTDVEATQALLSENNTLLDRVLEVTSVELPSSVELDTVALVDNLQDSGLDTAAAEELSQDLAQFVNPVGVNLELSNGTSVNALDSMVQSVGDDDTNISVDELTGSLLVDVGDAEIPVNVSKVALVPAAVPEGVTLLPDGSALSVSNGIGVTVVPAPSDPVGLVTALSEGVDDVALETNGSVTITSDEQIFSGTFGFDDAQQGDSGGVAAVTLNSPESGDPTDPDYTFTVDYPDGSRQNIAPFIADDNFFNSLDSRGLTFNTSRSTGVVTVIDETSNSVTQFRPDYFVTPLTGADQDFLAANADETGIAYRAIDVNGDGIMDFEAISATGVQVIYGLQ